MLLFGKITTTFNMKKTDIMNKILLLGFVITVFIYPIKSQDINYARYIIDTLCSDFMAGRGYTENGHLKAANFIEEEFVQNNLKNFIDSYFTEFKISANTFPYKTLVKLDNEILVEGKDYLIDPGSPSIKGIYKLHNWIPENPEDEIKLEEQISEIGNKIVVLDENSFENKDHLNIVRNMLFSLNDRESKHKGIIIIKSSKLTWHISNRVHNIPTIYLNQDFASTKFSEIELTIKTKFEKNIKTKNVIAYIEGTEIPDSFFVFTAHYDHLGKMGNAIFKGANDNASGVAMMLSLAKYFSNYPPEYSIVFIAFGAEELGLIGSSNYANNPLHNLERTKLLINLDLAGTGDDGIQVVNGSIYKTEFEKLVSINDNYNLLPNIKIRGESCNSDHCPFYIKGIPSFFIYTLGGIRAYHDIYDIPETLPLTEFEDYRTLLIKYIESF